MKKKDKNKKISKFSVFLIVVDVIAVVCFFVVYGPFSFFRDWFITTAMTTMTHRYFAYTLYSEDMIKEKCLHLDNICFKDFIVFLS